MSEHTLESHEILANLLRKIHIPGIKLGELKGISFCIYFTDTDTNDDFYCLSLSFWRYEEGYDVFGCYIESLLLDNERNNCDCPDLGYPYGERNFSDLPETIGEIIRLRNFIAIEKGIPQINHLDYIPFIQEMDDGIEHTCECFICKEKEQEKFSYHERLFHDKKEKKTKFFESTISVLQNMHFFPVNPDGSIFFENKLAGFMKPFSQKRNPMCKTCAKGLQSVGKYQPLIEN